MPLWVYIVCVLVVCACAWLWCLDRRQRNKFQGLPTYPLLSVFGNIRELLNNGGQLFPHCERMREICEASMLPVALWLGPYSLIVTQDPDDIKTITNAFIEKPYFYDFGRPWLGDGLVTAPVNIWKHNIKKLGGTFTSSVVDGYLDVFNAQAHKLVESLKTEVGKEPFDIIHKYLAYTTLETICQTALGVPKIAKRLVTTEYYEAFNRCLELMMSRGLNILMHPDIIYRLTPAHREMTKCVAVLHQVSDAVLNKRKLERMNTKEMKTEENNNDVKDGPKFKAFLDILMDLSETDPSLTEEQVKSEVDTIIVAGQETVASALFYVLLMIGSKPGVQKKIHAEFKSIFGESKRPVCKKDLSQMKYCEAVIHETLRLYPPVPGFLRYADRDLQLKSCIIPKGTTCGILTWGAGRSVRVWGPDAKLYRPERWLGDQHPGTPAAFVPFSYGRRACIGKKYAMAIIKTMLAHCVRELEFVSDADNLQLRIDIALRASSGHLMQVRLREQN